MRPRKVYPHMEIGTCEAYMVYHYHRLVYSLSGRRYRCDTDKRNNHMTKKKNIISITDIIESKVKRELELQEYKRQLSDLQEKKLGLRKSLNWVEKEIQTITSIIQKGITDNE